MARDPASPSISGARQRVLLVSWFFPPQAGPAALRIAKLAKYLPDHGWEPIALTTRDSDLDATDTSLLYDLPAGMTIARARAIPTWRLRRRAVSEGSATGPLRLARHLAAWPDEASGWVPAAIALGVRVARTRRPAAILSSSSPFSSHVVAWALQRLTGLPWIAEFRDEWARNPWRDVLDTGRRLDSLLEDAACASANAIITVNEQLRVGADSPAAAHGGWVIPNGFDPYDFRSNGAAPDAEGRTVLLHAGSVYGPRRVALEKLVTALRGLAAEGGPEVELRILGRRTVEIPGAERHLRSLPHVPHEQAIAVMRAAHGLVLLGSDDEYSDAIPTKTWEYLATDRPILCLAPRESEIGRLIQAAGGVVADPVDLDAIRQAVSEVVRSASGTRHGHPEVTDVLRRHERRILAGRTAQLLNRLVSPP